MSVVLVTGGAGYIGSHVCRRLAQVGHTPVCFDNFATGWRQAARFGPVVEGDLADPAALAAALAATRPAAVMHFAALSLVGDSVADPGRYWRTNVVGTLSLLEAMRQAGVGRLVFSSTAAVYGAPDRDLIDEDAPCAPTSPYGASKLAAETMLTGFGTAHGLRCMVFRYFNAAGAAPGAAIGEWHQPETHLVPLVVDAARGARPAITVFGDDYPTPDGTCIRDYVHVEDLADAHVLGLERLLAGGDGLTVNLGVGRGWSVREVIDRVDAVTGRTTPTLKGPRRPGDPARLVCDGSRAAADLGWHPRRSGLDDIIRDTWAWRQGRGYSA